MEEEGAVVAGAEDPSSPIKKKMKMEEVKAEEAGGQEQQPPPLPTAAAAAPAKPGTLWQIPKPVIYRSGEEGGSQRVSVRNSDPKVIVVGQTRASHSAGYRQARSVWGLSEGDCYFEVRRVELEGLGDGALRAGFASSFSPKDAPAGFDLHSYGLSTRTGNIIAASRPSPYTQEILPDDILGCYLHLPPLQPPLTAEVTFPPNPACVESETSEVWNVRIVEGEPYILPKAEPILRPHPGSYIEYYVNGRPLGKAFTNIPIAEYFPTVALYKSECVFNFGPQWKYPPKDLNPTPASRLAK